MQVEELAGGSYRNSGYYLEEAANALAEEADKKEKEKAATAATPFTIGGAQVSLRVYYPRLVGPPLVTF